MSVLTSHDFVPASEWDIPQIFTDAEVVSQGIHLDDARACVRAMNTSAIQLYRVNRVGWNRRWTIAIACPRNKGFDRLLHTPRAPRGFRKTPKVVGGAL